MTAKIEIVKQITVKANYPLTKGCKLPWTHGGCGPQKFEEVALYVIHYEKFLFFVFKNCMRRLPVLFQPSKHITHLNKYNFILSETKLFYKVQLYISLVCTFLQYIFGKQLRSKFNYNVRFWLVDVRQQNKRLLVSSDSFLC